jgi:tRNA-specific 2-thiouridylase
VRCNDWLKFGRLHEYAKQIDADFVASGHYARIQRASDPAATLTDCNPWASTTSTRLLRGVDHSKDQSYVLFGAPKARLSEMLLPIGGYQKSRVREMAKEFGLPVFDKPDSQEICFVPDNDYAGLVKRKTPGAVVPGRIMDTSGKFLGEHEGQQHFTIGQRKGVRLALGNRMYVVSKDALNNTVVVGDKGDLRADGLIAGETNWHIEPSDSWMPCTAKIRYNAQPVAAEVRSTAADELELRFIEPQFAVAPGQAVVCYDGEALVCGGWIAEAR